MRYIYIWIVLMGIFINSDLGRQFKHRIDRVTVISLTDFWYTTRKLNHLFVKHNLYLSNFI